MKYVHTYINSFTLKDMLDIMYQIFRGQNESAMYSSSENVKRVHITA